MLAPLDRKVTGAQELRECHGLSICRLRFRLPQVGESSCLKSCSSLGIKALLFHDAIVVFVYTDDWPRPICKARATCIVFSDKRCFAARLSSYILQPRAQLFHIEHIESSHYCHCTMTDSGDAKPRKGTPIIHSRKLYCTSAHGFKVKAQFLLFLS